MARPTSRINVRLSPYHLSFINGIKLTMKCNTSEAVRHLIDVAMNHLDYNHEIQSKILSDILLNRDSNIEDNKKGGIKNGRRRRKSKENRRQP